MLMNFLSPFNSTSSAKKFFVYLFIFVIASEAKQSLAQGPDSWIQKNDMSSAGAADRSRAVGISIGNFVYVGTGWDGTQNWAGWWRYDPATDTWAQMSDFTSAFPAGTARRECVAFSVGGFGYLGLGTDGSNTFQGLWKYDPGNNTWVNVNNTNIPRYAPVSFVIGSKAYVTTGYDPPGSPAYKNDLWEYNPSTDTWTAKANFPGVARYEAIGFSVGGYGYVGTGIDGSGAYQKDFWQYNPQTNVWVQKAGIPNARAYASAFSIKGKGYVVGGFNGSSAYDETWEYNPISNQWTARANFAPGNRYRGVGLSLNGKGYVGTGTSTGSNLFGDLWEYTPENIPAITFQKSYGGTNDDTDTSRVAVGFPTSDGGYIIASSTNSFAAKYDVCLIKTDPYGSEQWSKNYGSSTSDEMACSVKQTTDGGYIIVGYTYLSPSNQDAFIIKTTSSGNVIWAKNNTGGSIQRANDVKEIPGGYIITGANGTGASLVKLTTSGALTFANSISRASTTYIEGYSIEQTAAGNYIVGGEYKSISGSIDSYVMATTSAGNITSSISYSYNSPNNGNDTRSSIHQTPDGGFIICGSTNTTPNNGGSDFFLIKTDNLANVQWSSVYGGALDDFGHSLAVTSTGKYIVGGFTKSFGAGNEDAFLSCIDIGGNVLWTKAYGGTGIEKANSVYETADGGFVLFGESSSFTSGMRDVYVIKTDSLGNSGCNENIGSFAVLSSTFVRTGTNTTGTLTLGNPIVAFTSQTTSVTDLCISCTFPIGIFQNDVGCFGDCDGDAMVTAAGGALPYTYLWSNGATIDFISGLCSGGYTVTVTDATGICTAVDSVYINEPTQLLVSVASDTVDICLGFDDTISASASGGDTSNASYSYAWNPVTGLSCTACANPTANPTVSTAYTVTVTDGNGCTATNTTAVMVHLPPAVSAGPDVTICPGFSTTIGSATISGVNYSWTPPSGLNNTTIANPTATPTDTIQYSVIGTTAFGCLKKDSVIVTVAPTPTVAISTTSSGTVCEGTTVVLNAIGSLGTYLWSTTATTFTVAVVPTVTTTYSVTITNAAGCTASASYTQNVNPRPWPIFITTDATCFDTCNGQSTASPIAGTFPFTYQWNTSPVQTTPTATGLCDTVYTVFIVDANGCSAGGTDTISEPTPVNMVITPTDAICPCSGSAIDSAFGGTPPYNYLWSPGGETTSAITGLCAGIYDVTVTDNNGCSDLHTITILQLPPLVVSVSSADTICSGTTTTIGANASGNSGITYLWFPGSIIGDTISVSPSATTTYIVIATDISTNCSDTDSVVVAVVQTPVVSISGNDTICSGGTTALTGSGTGNYLWSTTQTTPVIFVSPTITTIYSLTVTATSGNTSCFDVDSFGVAVISSPVISVYQKYDTICFGLSFDTLIASGGTNYSWSSAPPTFPPIPNNDTIILSPDLQGQHTYTVFVSSGNGCTGTSTVTVVVQGGFQPPTVTGTFSYCDGDSILPVNITPPTLPPALVVWFDSTSTQIAAGNIFLPPQNLLVGTTSYLVIQGTSDACVSYPTVVTFTINPLPIVDAGNDITICSGHTAQLNATGGTTYLWSPSTYLNDSAIANPSANPDSTFSYQVLASDGNNCRDRDSVTVYIAINDTCGIHIYNVISPNGDDDNDIWWIDGINLFPENFVEIFNRWGNSVWHGKNYDNRKVVWRGQNMFNQPLPAGTYYYVIDVKGLGRFTGWVELLR